MKLATYVGIFFLVFVLYSVPAHAQAPGTPVFDNILSPLPGDVLSWNFKETSTSEMGDEIRLEAGTPRRLGFVTVTLSVSAKLLDYPGMPTDGFIHPLTIKLYLNAASAASNTPLVSVSQAFKIKWRPEADPTCGSGWRYSATRCYEGLAQNVTFDLRYLNLDLPNQFIAALAYNTSTHGYNPIGVPGPYDSINAGFANVDGIGFPPSVGVDVNPNTLYLNSSHSDFYADGGAGGIGFLRPDTGWWQGLEPTFRFTTFAVPVLARDCKNGAWQNLARANGTLFKNQTECVDYVSPPRK